MPLRCYSICTCRFRDDHDQGQAFGALVIVGGVYVIGVIIFQIWTITVANKARKEISDSKMNFTTVKLGNKEPFPVTNLQLPS